MTQITAAEKGRNLILTVGEEGEDDTVTLTVRPVNAETGATLLALWLGIAFGHSSKPQDDATALGKTALGEDNWPALETLRSAEATDVINAAFFWNVQGGGIDLVNEMLRDGLPKAQETLASRNGFGQELSQLTTLLLSVAASETRAPAGTSGTSTPVGSSGSFGATRTPQEKAPDA